MKTLSKGKPYYDERWRIENDRTSAPNEARIQKIIDATTRYFKAQNIPVASCLDVGCGNGWILKRMSEMFPGCELFGIEPSQVGAENAKKRVPTAVIECASLKTAKFKRDFKLVICSEVLEHVHDQQEFLRSLSGYLSDDGFIVLTMPNGLFRNGYFSIYGISPQPIENWLTGPALEDLMGGCFYDVRVKSFDLSHWRTINPRLNRLRKSIMCIRGGWRLMRTIDDFYLLPRMKGLYLIGTGKR
jgi:SAM-dependent methyltransferase